MLQFFKRGLNKLAFVAPGGYTVRPRLQRLRGVRIGKGVWVSQYVYFDELHPEAITIADNCTIGLRSSIITHLYWGPRRISRDAYKEVVIERDAYVGPHCVILPGVRIGEGAVIKGGTAVTRDVPPHTFWGPPPAGPLAQATVPLTPDHSYEEFYRGLKPIRRRPPLSPESDS